MVMGDTLVGPGGDAALVRVHGTNKALALTTDVTPRYCLADPVAVAGRPWPKPIAISVPPVPRRLPLPIA